MTTLAFSLRFLSFPHCGWNVRQSEPSRGTAKVASLAHGIARSDEVLHGGLPTETSTEYKLNRNGKTEWKFRNSVFTILWRCCSLQVNVSLLSQEKFYARVFGETPFARRLPDGTRVAPQHQHKHVASSFVRHMGLPGTTVTWCNAGSVYIYILDLSWSVCQSMLLKHGHFLDLPQARLKAWLATLATAVEKQEAFVQCIRKLECQWMQIQIPPNSRNFAVILTVLLQMIWQSKRYLRFYIFHFLSVHLEHWYVLVQQHPLDVRLDPANWQVPPMAAAITLLFLHTPLLGRPSIPKHSINSIVIGDADVTCNRTIWENIRKVTSKGLFFCFRMQVVVRWFWGLWMVLKVPKQNFQ